MTVEYVVDHASPGNESLDKKFYAPPSLNLKYELNPKNTLRFRGEQDLHVAAIERDSPYRYVNIGFASRGTPI